MSNIKIDTNCIGKTVNYLDKQGRAHSNRIIGVNVKKKYCIIIGDFPSDFPIKIFARFIDSITGETSKVVNTIKPEFRDKPGYNQFNY